MKGTGEIQCLRRDGAVAHYAFSTEAQLKKVCEYLGGFYFGQGRAPKTSEELEVKDDKNGI